MSGLSSNIILDEWFNKVMPKPINNRPGYDMKYVSAYIVNYCYGTDLKKIIISILTRQVFKGIILSTNPTYIKSFCEA